MKIVIEYYSGSEYEGSHLVECLQADSCEEVYCKIEENVQNYINSWKNLSLPEIYKNERFIIYGKEFSASDFTSFNKKDKTRVFDPPGIYELNEWFELKLNGEI